MSLLAPERINVSTLPVMSLTERDQLPNVAAIYFVLDATDRIQYIGRAKRLCFRWATHHLSSRLEKMQGIRIAYLTVTDINLLPSVEKALIAYFHPPLNRHGSNANFHSVMFRLPEDVFQALRKAAKAGHRPLNTQVILTMREALNLPDPSDPKQSKATSA